MEYMDEDGFLTEFKRTEEFENLIAEYTGAKHCIVVNNGTVSLTLAALAAGIKANDEVLIPKLHHGCNSQFYFHDRRKTSLC